MSKNTALFSFCPPLFSCSRLHILANACNPNLRKKIAEHIPSLKREEKSDEIRVSV
jgi:hypothetical protein